MDPVQLRKLLTPNCASKNFLLELYVYHLLMLLVDVDQSLLV